MADLLTYNMQNNKLMEQYVCSYKNDILPIFESITAIVMEADLKPYQIETLFSQLEKQRTGKNFIGNTIDAGKETVNDISKLTSDAKTAISSIYNQAIEHPITSRLETEGAAAMQYAKTKITAAYNKVKELNMDPEQKEKILRYISEMAKYAMEHPKFTAFVVATFGTISVLLGSGIGASLSVAILARLALEKLTASRPATESIVYEAGLMDYAKNMGSKFAEYATTGKPKVSKDEMIVKWKERGSPTDINDIVRMLTSQFGITSTETKNALKAMKKNNVDVSYLAKQIKAAGLTKEVLLDIEDRLKSPDTLTDSIIFEKNLSDADILNLFKNLTTNTATPAKTASSTKNINDYVKQWATQINATTDKNQKYALVKEIVNFLSDRYNTPEWKNVVKGVQNIISRVDADPRFLAKANQSLGNGTVIEKRLYSIISLLLTECQVEWKDFRIHPVLLESGKIKLKYTLFQNMKLMESFFEDVVIHNMVNDKMIGRRRKQ